MADHLDLRVVLIGPEVGHRRVRICTPAAGEQAPRRGHPLFGRVRPVLDPDLRPEPVVEPARQVARHHHVVGRVQGGVGADAVADLEAGVGQPLRRRRHAYPHHDDVGGDHGAVHQCHPGHLGATTRVLAHQA